MNLIDRRVLKDKVCVLLNDAQRHFPDLGPIAFANNKKFLKFCTLPYQCVKARLRFDPHPERDDNHVNWEDDSIYCYSYREPPWDKVSHHDESTMWKEPCHYWAPRRGSVSAFAVQFAVWAGAKSITLAGCDCNVIEGAHYVHTKNRHERVHEYHQYAVGLLRLWKECQLRGIPMVSLQPFFGVGWHREQFGEMTAWLASRGRL